MFDFFDIKFSHLSYLKLCAKYDLKLTMFTYIFWIRVVKDQKSETSYNFGWKEYEGWFEF
jgi:hypothetical protein